MKETKNTKASYVNNDKLYHYGKSPRQSSGTVYTNEYCTELPCSSGYYTAKVLSAQRFDNKTFLKFANR